MRAGEDDQAAGPTDGAVWRGSIPVAGRWAPVLSLSKDPVCRRPADDPAWPDMSI